MAQGAVVLGVGGMITYCNSSFANLLGLPIQLIIGKDMLNFVVESDRSLYEGEADKAALLPSTTELGLKASSGERIDASVSFTTMPSDPRNVVCMIVTDLRPQKKSMEALRESREWFQVLADSMPHIVWTTDARGHATYFNRRWYEFTSRTQTMKPDDTDDIASILHPRDLPHYQALWAHVVDDPQAFHMECRIREAATQSYRWHLIRGLPVTNKGGMSLQWICTCTDIHEQKCTEQELARSNDELAQFAFVASHDLQEPLRKVMNYVGVFAAKYQDLVDESGHKYLTQILEGSRRMRDLIQGLLTLSRVGHENLEAETLMMSRVMDDVLSDQAGQISEAEARIEVQPLPLLKIPRSELYQVFSNIMGNALKFKSRDVPLVVLVRAAHLAHDDLELIIQDNGIGIESEYLEQVFVPFKRLHTQNKYPGAGLGLAICRKIIERHGGRIWMESILGRGTSVHVVFPSQLVVWNQERP